MRRVLLIFGIVSWRVHRGKNLAIPDPSEFQAPVSASPRLRNEAAITKYKMAVDVGDQSSFLP